MTAFQKGVNLRANHSEESSTGLRTHLQNHPLHEAHMVENGHDAAEEDDDGQNLPGNGEPLLRGAGPGPGPFPQSLASQGSWLEVHGQALVHSESLVSLGSSKCREKP